MTKKSNISLMFSILSIFAFTNCLGAVDGAFSKIATALNISHTNALYIGSVPALASTLACLAFGMLIGKKLPYKGTAVFCSTLMIITGVLPVFAHNLAFILICRLLFGIGAGGLSTLQNPIVTKLVEADRRPVILGLGTSVSFGIQCVLQLVGGVLADISWNYVFLTYALLLLPLLLQIIRLPHIAMDTQQAATNKGSKLPTTVFALSVMMFLVGLNVSPLLFGSAFYAAALNDSATIAAVIAMMFSIGSMLGGLIFPFLQQHLAQRSLSGFLTLAAIGFIISARATNIPLLAIGFLLGGIGFACVMSCNMMIFGLICQPNQIPLASSLMFSCMNCGFFLCSAWQSLLGSLTNDTLYSPLYIGTGIFLLIAIVLLIKTPFPKHKTI